MLNSADVKALLRARYCQPEWSIFFEVGLSTGSSSRYADAIAINLFTSHSHEIWGFEIKLSRSDWLSELKNPTKTEETSKYCNRWWIVAPSEVVKENEIPAGWGFLSVRDTGLRQTRMAEIINKPTQEVDRCFVAALLRRCGQQEEVDIASIIKERVMNCTKQHQKEINEIRSTYDRKYNSEIERIKSITKEIKDRTEIDLSTWRPTQYHLSVINLSKILIDKQSKIAEINNMASCITNAIKSIQGLNIVEKGELG